MKALHLKAQLEVRIVALELVTLILDHHFFCWGGGCKPRPRWPPGLFACKQFLVGKGSNLTWWKLRGSCFGLFCARTDTIYVSTYLPSYLTIYPSSYLILSYLILSYLILSYPFLSENFGCLGGYVFLA